ncbi:MAG: peptidase S41 [Gammaproteobacteria bacterium]|nr:MAG: peptidase S41 [Gammaproteobacteria bacterium]
MGFIFGVLLTVTITVVGKTSTGSIPLKEISAFTDVFEKVKSDYVEEISDKDLMEHAIEGLLAGLDPHSAYLSPDDLQELQESTSGKFGGLGIQVSMEDGFVKVVAPIDDTPAYEAGIQSGDIFIRLDDKPVKGMTLSDAVDIMRGEPGTSIVLTVVRDGTAKPFKVKITRAIIKTKSVKSKVLDDKYGYIRISQFQVNTTYDLKQAITKLKKDTDNKMAGIIIDLRNNPGGVLRGAIGVSNTFISKGVVVSTKGREKTANKTYNASGSDILSGKPIVVLVNEGSASASEIVAGALQDHRRAVIVGTQTFGKGSVQSIHELSNGGAIKLTTARYFTPNGTSIQNEGIVPDIEVDKLKISSVEKSIDPLKEADLEKHISNPNKKISKKIKQEKSAKKSKDDKKDNDDYQLNTALNILKGLSITR